MECDQIILQLKELSSEKYKENVAKLGIPVENSIGVTIGDIRRLAKTIKKSNDLAFALWKTGYHEAKLLAVLLFDTKTVELEEVMPLMKEVISWDLCNHICQNLYVKLNGYQRLIFEWSSFEQLYYKRAAFVLIAATVIHEKDLPPETIDKYLELLKTNSEDEREHVKKAISTALREIGKRDYECQEKAVLLSHDLKASVNKAQRWIGRDALKEIENLVKAKGRGRLISADSQMGSVRRYE